MKTRMMLAVVILGVVLSAFVGCEQAQKTKKEAKIAPKAKQEAKPAPKAKQETKLVSPKSEKEAMMLRFSPKRETVYKVVAESGKDYSFVQPSANKSKERHTTWRTEIVFVQKIENVDQQGNAVADITIKQLKYVTQDADGKLIDFDSTAEGSKSNQLSSLIGQSYKIKISPSGKIEVVDAAAVRGVIKGESSAKQIADKLFSNEEIEKRHQVLALNDVGKNLCKKGDKWSSVAASPQGMLRQKSFEKVYTLADIKKQNENDIAVVTMTAAPSSKRADDAKEGESTSGFFTNMFDEKDNYTGKMVLDLTTGEIESYNEKLKVEWFAAEPPKDQQGDKEPDQLTMGFSYLYSIEKTK